ncbi:hypothetical protein DAPPUDRAFT_304031 [Daphnia pulex]|uniref:Uncharacterized protein n=1 Tax=Daphnia pulex TaxID=6669 RepID=E9GJB1_DAPPU|nr:hypothetical protein DAPPUDRAFT_304031 [Daphnia pulex]|eukprot:EFX80517.1 hypothetical protein DAPPUDRAFT_304031 [Daphnia pulex]
MLSVLWILWNPIVGSLLASVLAIYYWIQTRFERQSWQTYQLVQNFFGDSVRTINWGTIGWDLKGEMLFPNPN